MPLNASRLRNWLNDAAAGAGFHSVHVTAATLPEITGIRLRQFIAQGCAGDMSWLADTAARRSEPTAMWSDAVSAIVLTMNYGPDHDPMDNIRLYDRGNISVYARGRDYHNLLKGKLKQLAGQFAARSTARVKVFVDTAPLMEKPLAAQSGAGWQGKHTNLVSRSAGSWLFIGTILTDAALLYDDAEIDHCGSCTNCLDICPTNAFIAPYQLDARRCISYLTIEHKGQIPKIFRRAIGNRVFGCDDCLAVCPWNKFAERAQENKFFAHPSMPTLSDLLSLDDASFRKRYAGSPVRRVGYERFMRNVLVAAGNSEDKSLVPFIENKLGNNSPLVRGMAVWAFAQLADKDAFKGKKLEMVKGEFDENVLSEWGL